MAAVRKLKAAAPVAAASATTSLAAAERANGVFLNVTRSAKGMSWRERLPGSAAAAALTISQRNDLPEWLGRVLAARGITPETTAVFLDPTIKALMPDPSVLAGMDAGAGRIADAVTRSEPVAIFGDYDVDGASSAALHAPLPCASRRRLPRLHSRSPVRRLRPESAAIGMLADEGAKLIVTVDCGTTSFEPLAVAKTKGVDVVVIDHHQADERLPDVSAVINPNRQDDVSEVSAICARPASCFIVLVAVTRELRARGALRDDRQRLTC